MSNIIALILLICISPLIFLAIIICGLFNNLKVFYVSKRFININREIKIYKFMTMHHDIKARQPNLNNIYNLQGFLRIPLSLKVYTLPGIILEYFEFVEVLQLINILKGEMRFVGNRPLPHDNLLEISKFQGYEKRFLCPSGMTGIAQLVWKVSPNPQERIDLEIAYSLIYKNRQHRLMDLKIIIATLIYITTRNKSLIFKLKSELISM